MKTFVGPSPLAMSSAASATMGQEPAPDPRLQIMLNGPIAGTLLRFAAPTIVVVTVTLHFGGVQLRHFADILSVAGIAPHLWIGIFSNAPDVTSTGQTYLQIVGPFYGCVGAAMIFYFSSQGAGRMLWPFVGGIIRLVLATVGGWIAVHQFGAGLAGLSWMISASFVVFSLVSALALRRGAWRRDCCQFN